MQWLPKQFVLWGTNILQAVAICSSALSIALMMRSSTCLISTGIDTIKRLFFYLDSFCKNLKDKNEQVCNLGQSYYKLSMYRHKKKGKDERVRKGRKLRFDSHVVSFPSCFKYLNTALILHLFP